MTTRDPSRLAAALALAVTALAVSPLDARACGSWEEAAEKILALDAEADRALVLVTTTGFGYGGTTESHRLFVVDLRAPRADGSSLVVVGSSIELHLRAREQTMPAAALAARLVRRHAASFPIRVTV